MKNVNSHNCKNKHTITFKSKQTHFSTKTTNMCNFVEKLIHVWMATAIINVIIEHGHPYSGERQVEGMGVGKVRSWSDAGCG